MSNGPIRKHTCPHCNGSFRCITTEREIDRLREALRKYGGHQPHCFSDDMQAGCGCGYLQALKGGGDE